MSLDMFTDHTLDPIVEKSEWNYRHKTTLEYCQALVLEKGYMQKNIRKDRPLFMSMDVFFLNSSIFSLQSIENLKRLPDCTVSHDRLALQGLF